MTIERPPEDPPEPIAPLAEPDGLAGALPDLLTAPVQSELEAAGPATTSISIAAADAITEPEVAEEPAPEIPALPEPAEVEPQPLPERPEKGPEGFWPRTIYKATLGLVSPKDSWRVRERKELEERIARPLDGTFFIPVLSAKGGVGATTVAALLGMTLAATREDRVVAIDANPDRGTLGERVDQRQSTSVRDVVIHARAIQRAGGDIAQYVAGDSATGLNVLASDIGPLRSGPFDGGGLQVVADILAGGAGGSAYAVAVTDTGAGLLHSVTRTALSLAQTCVVVSGGGVDEARLASDALTWLESNEYGELVRNAVVVINTATPGTSVARLEEIGGHFSSRVRAVVFMPYDPGLAAGAIIDFAGLLTETRLAALDLAAAAMDGAGGADEDVE